jgi:hypothetical protein
MTRLRLLLLNAVVAATTAACCSDGKCLKDPPCRCGENPCCLSPIQKAALKVSTHALPSGPLVYSMEDKIFILFSEKGQKDFEKDPVGYDEKGAIRVIRKGKVYRVDVKMATEDEPNWAELASRAVPYTAPPPAPK